MLVVGFFLGRRTCIGFFRVYRFVSFFVYFRLRFWFVWVLESWFGILEKVFFWVEFLFYFGRVGVLCCIIFYGAFYGAWGVRSGDVKV